MRLVIRVLLILSVVFPACGQKNESNQEQKENNFTSHINPEGMTVETRFKPPEGFIRTKIHDGSFEKYLRILPLKPDGSEVLFYNGEVKTNNNIYDAVINLEIGKKDLHQCADAIMRLRAEYLRKNGKDDEIHFNFTNGFRVDYSEWMDGKRIAVKGNKTYWVKKFSPSNTYKDFWDYMEIVFTYAGTYSLEKELISTGIKDIRIGDIFIHGGFPGHAIIVVDMAVNSDTEEIVFLLAQSYMPAQELQILKNPNNEKLSPWYSINFRDELITPEWKFDKTNLKRFAQ